MRYMSSVLAGVAWSGGGGAWGGGAYLGSPAETGFFSVWMVGRVQNYRG